MSTCSYQQNKPSNQKYAQIFFHIYKQCLNHTQQGINGGIIVISAHKHVSFSYRASAMTVNISQYIAAHQGAALKLKQPPGHTATRTSIVSRAGWIEHFAFDCSSMFELLEYLEQL